ncbi:LacI family transcriptional regulator (plasmid) [Hymenobacter tibetensis]|uniref:LacI family transcriptional regulator n=1 Tax=Hymenobacter tibetensis TaxID=497967 RepID=A0ABY4D5Q6_9BACT|nr:LacI family DNA-binding transcriptional regulator [Hymenobacter tibetensis]UOG77382.1 LacI family transcriptional regulator [Hymenobacter tibetensis]
MLPKPTTLKELANLLGISISTVSRALNDHPSIGSATVQKVKKLAADLHYEPNQTAVSFQKGKTFTIGVILPELSEAFFSSAITAIEEAAYKQNYTVLLAQSHDDELKEKQVVEKMRHHRVDGLLVSVAKTTSSFEHFDRLRQSNIPVVFFDRIPPLPNIHYVACDLIKGTTEAVNYLLKKGHRTIGMINGPATLCASSERREGYIKAMMKSKLKYDPSLVVECDLSEKGTQSALELLLANKRNVSAIVTFNDYIWIYALHHAKCLQLDICNTVEFVSYANLPLVAYMDHTPSASVEQFPLQQGQKATEILLDLLRQKSRSSDHQQAFYHVTIDSKLVEGQPKPAQIPC